MNRDIHGIEELTTRQDILDGIAPHEIVARVQDAIENGSQVATEDLVWLLQVVHTLYLWHEAFPCDGLCIDMPEEDCSRHGRKPAELWKMIPDWEERAPDPIADAVEACMSVYREARELTAQRDPSATFLQREAQQRAERHLTQRVCIANGDLRRAFKEHA